MSYITDRKRVAAFKTSKLMSMPSEVAISGPKEPVHAVVCPYCHRLLHNDDKHKGFIKLMYGNKVCDITLKEDSNADAR